MSTEHIYYGNICNSARRIFLEYLPPKKNGFLLDNLYSLKEGLWIRNHLITFYQNLFIFNLNNLISQNQFELTEEQIDDASYDYNKFIPLSMMRESKVPKFILEELKASKYIKKFKDCLSEKESLIFIKEYFIKNLFKMIYKYLTGIMKLYKYDGHCVKLHNVTEKIIGYLNDYTYQGICALEKSFPKVKLILRIKETLRSIYEKNKEFKETTPILLIKGERFEEEEITKPYYYKYKRYCLILIVG